MGNRKPCDVSLEIDSIAANADTTSLRGNFVMLDSTIMFVDQLYCKIFSYDRNEGDLNCTYSGYGQGPNEMTGIMYGAPVNPGDTLMWIFDSSYGVYESVPSKNIVSFKGRIDFGWNKPSKDDYAAISNYAPMEMSDFGLKLTCIDDSTILVPLSLINRNFSKTSDARYEKGRILGKLNTNTMEIKELWGRFPDFYTNNPLPFFEFFDYAVDKAHSQILVNHAPDSLIYRYAFNGDLINTFGFEPEGINRDYTKGFDVSPEAFKTDIQEVGVNTGLYYDDESQLLFRTIMKDFTSGITVMQVYKDNDLIIEKLMPSYFKLLGKYRNRYYGVRLIPKETDDESQFLIYSFQLPQKNIIHSK